MHICRPIWQVPRPLGRIRDWGRGGVGIPDVAVSWSVAGCRGRRGRLVVPAWTLYCTVLYCTSFVCNKPAVSISMCKYYFWMFLLSAFPINFSFLFSISYSSYRTVPFYTILLHCTVLYSRPFQKGPLCGKFVVSGAFSDHMKIIKYFFLKNVCKCSSWTPPFIATPHYNGQDKVLKTMPIWCSDVRKGLLRYWKLGFGSLQSLV